MASRVRTRRLRWWHWLLHREVREAARTARNVRELQIVDYTEGGLAIKMPAAIADTWEQMPLEVRARFMADMDATKRAGAQDGGLNDWRE